MIINKEINLDQLQNEFIAKGLNTLSGFSLVENNLFLVDEAGELEDLDNAGIAVVNKHVAQKPEPELSLEDLRANYQMGLTTLDAIIAQTPNAQIRTLAQIQKRVLRYLHSIT